MMSYFGWLQSINQSLGAYIHWGGALPHPPHDAKSGGPSEQVSMQAPFPAEAYERMKKLFQKPLRCQEELDVKCVFPAMITSLNVDLKCWNTCMLYSWCLYLFVAEQVFPRCQEDLGICCTFPVTKTSLNMGPECWNTCKLYPWCLPIVKCCNFYHRLQDVQEIYILTLYL